MAKKATAPKAPATKGKKETAKKAPAKAQEPVKPEVVGVDALVAEVVAETGITKKDAESAVRATFNAIMNLNAENKNVQIVGFGNFEVRGRGERKGRNPQTGDEITIQASILPALKSGATYKKRVKEQTPERKEPKAEVVAEAEVDTVDETAVAPKAEKKAKSADKKVKSKKNKKGSKKNK